jgi:hypothetical protein
MDLTLVSKDSYRFSFVCFFFFVCQGERVLWTISHFLAALADHETVQDETMNGPFRPLNGLDFVI